MKHYAAQLLPSLLALAGALAVSALIIAVSGHSPAAAFGALVAGAFGSLDSASEVAVKTCPLLLTGLAIAIAFQAGVWNIGAEGQLLMGALTMTVLGTHRVALPAWLDLGSDLVVAAVAGALWAGIAGQLKRRRNVNEVISTIMLNFIALGLISYLVQGPLMEAGGRYPQSDAIMSGLWMPRLVPPHRVHAGLVLALLIAAAVQVLLYRTVAGYELRAAGLNPDAARLAGIDVGRRLLFALMLSGALAGLNMDIVSVSPIFNLYDEEWPIRTHQRQYPPAKFVFAEPGRTGTALDSIVSNGCIVSGGIVKNSILSPNVRVNSYSEVDDCILFSHVSVGRRCRIRRAILDRDVHVPEGTTIGYDAEADRQRYFVTDSGITVVTRDYSLFENPIEVDYFTSK